ncbi:predicted protein, partial [Nematostella vectensis]
AHSCRHLQKIGREKGITYPSGIYTINPGRRGNVKTYCDMSRDGGGWTLLVTSHTNTWTPSVVRKRNENKPSLDDDFSILSEADSIKDEMYVKGATFEYRIEAQQFGRWGGIWTAPRHYTFLSTNNSQQGVELVRRFDEWVYHDYGIEKTMPWIHGATLTTSRNATHVAYGTITGNDPKSYPAAWINEKEHERHPINICVSDGTKLVYTDSQCDGRDAVFLYVGLTLKHECSGKYVCPEGRTGYDFLVLKTKCDADIEKFNSVRKYGIRTTSGSLTDTKDDYD